MTARGFNASLLSFRIALSLFIMLGGVILLWPATPTDGSNFSPTMLTVMASAFIVLGLVTATFSVRGFRIAERD